MSRTVQGIIILVVAGMDILVKVCFLLRSTGYHHALGEIALKLSGIFAQIYFHRIAFG